VLRQRSLPSDNYDTQYGALVYDEEDALFIAGEGNNSLSGWRLKTLFYRYMRSCRVCAAKEGILK
jgi:hypothetical protein